jgi:uncharacterized protein YndB with AHSA1/START domain
MAHVSIEMAAPREAVWRVLATPETYGEWVVGTKAIVRADADWPKEGTALEYELGVGLLTVGDRTVVVEVDPPRLLVLRAELKRLGSAIIRIELEERGRATLVSMDEAPVEGLVDSLHTSISDAALAKRNEVALERLRRLAEAKE